MKKFATINIDIFMDDDRYDNAGDRDLDVICDKIDDMKAKVRKLLLEYIPANFDPADGIDIDDHY